MRYLGIEVDYALQITEQTEFLNFVSDPQLQELSCKSQFTDSQIMTTLKPCEGGESIHSRHLREARYQSDPVSKEPNAALSIGVTFASSGRTEKDISSDSLIRINKYICESGICSRKAADIHVERGVVFINGKQALLGDKVSSGDKVTVNGLAIEPLATDKVLFIALNKPVGIVCTAAITEKRNIVDFVGHNSRIFPVGRLDKDSQGLIFLTNRCDLVNKILCAGSLHEKEYVVTVNKEITDDFITGISTGVPMLGVITKECVAVKESPYIFRITLVQGLNRQIRRMCKHYNYSVEKLERVRIMHIKLSGLSMGQWRELAEEELSELFQLLENPS